MNQHTIEKIKIGQSHYQITTDDHYLDNMGGVFEPHMVNLFKALISPDDSVADIGANIGMTSILFSQLSAEVAGFEPSPSTYNLLVKNLNQNSVENVKAVNCGIGDKKQLTTLTYSDSLRAGGFVSDQIDLGVSHTTEAVKIDRFDDIWERHLNKLDFMKIDVEGYELNVIKGSLETIKKHKPIVALETQSLVPKYISQDLCPRLPG